MAAAYRSGCTVGRRTDSDRRARRARWASRTLHLVPRTRLGCGACFRSALGRDAYRPRLKNGGLDHGARDDIRRSAASCALGFNVMRVAQRDAVGRRIVGSTGGYSDRVMSLHSVEGRRAAGSGAAPASLGQCLGSEAGSFGAAAARGIQLRGLVPWTVGAERERAAGEARLHHPRD